MAPPCHRAAPGPTRPTATVTPEITARAGHAARWLLVVCGCVLASARAQAEIVVSPAAGQELGLTIYHADLGLVRDLRRVSLPTGTSRLAITGISSQIQPETALLSSDKPLEVLAQYYRFDALSADTLLERYVGREIGVARINPASGEETHLRAKLLSVRDGAAVFRIGDSIETDGALSPWRFILDPDPDLREQPTLVAEVDTAVGGEQSLELGYLSRGLSWEADYVVRLGPGGVGTELLAWASIHNATGTTYPAARVQLVAGEINRIGGLNEVELRTQEMPAALPAAEDRLFEYQLYSLERPVTLPARQSVHVPLFAALKAPVQKLYRVTAPLALFGTTPGVQDLKVQTALRFTHTGEVLGRPLPSGVMRVYQQEAGGAGQFLGEARINPVPAGEETVIDVGTSLDIGARRRQLDYKRLPRDEQEAAWTIEFHNTKPEAVAIEVTQPFTGAWRIVEENLTHRRDSADLARWDVNVPAGGRTLLAYRVRTR